MRRIYSILVENRSGVLCKVAGLFWRRCFNIESIVVRIVDMSGNLMTIQMCDTPERVQIFINTLKVVSIVEIARSGAVAMTKCSE